MDAIPMRPNELDTGGTDSAGASSLVSDTKRVMAMLQVLRPEECSSLARSRSRILAAPT